MSMPSQFGTNPTPPAKSGPNWVVIILVILAVIVLVCGGLCAGAMFLARSAGGTLMQTAVLLSIEGQASPAINSNREVIDKLGSITGQGMPELVGAFDANAPQVTCKFTVDGAKGQATATVVATKDGANFTPSDIKVQFADGTTVSVPPNNSPTDLNFPTDESSTESHESIDMPEETPEAPVGEPAAP